MSNTPISVITRHIEEQAKLKPQNEIAFNLSSKLLEKLLITFGSGVVYPINIF